MIVNSLRIYLFQFGAVIPCTTMTMTPSMRWRIAILLTGIPGSVQTLIIVIIYESTLVENLWLQSDRRGCHSQKAIFYLVLET